MDKNCLNEEQLEMLFGELPRLQAMRSDRFEGTASVLLWLLPLLIAKLPDADRQAVQARLALDASRWHEGPLGHQWDFSKKLLELLTPPRAQKSPDDPFSHQDGTCQENQAGLAKPYKPQDSQ
jgi:hypothetical protein